MLIESFTHSLRLLKYARIRLPIVEVRTKRYYELEAVKLDNNGEYSGKLVARELGNEGDVGKNANKVGEYPENVKFSPVSLENISKINVVKYGEDFGKMGIYVEHPNIKVDWSKNSVHGLERLEQRGLSTQQIDNFVKDGKVLSQNNGEKFVFITKDGVAILSKQGKLVTAWGKNNFDEEMIDIITRLFGG